MLAQSLKRFKRTEGNPNLGCLADADLASRVRYRLWIGGCAAWHQVDWDQRGASEHHGRGGRLRREGAESASVRRQRAGGEARGGDQLGEWASGVAAVGGADWSDQLWRWPVLVRP